MANVCLPIKFQVFKGNQLLREEMLSEPIIKIGKLSSSTLRLEEETVSRMHAVIEVAGSGAPQLIDLGSTRGTTVNGARVDRAMLKSGDQIQFWRLEGWWSASPRRTDNALAPPRNDNAIATPPPVEVVSSPASMSSDDVQLEDGTRAIEVRSVLRRRGDPHPSLDRLLQAEALRVRPRPCSPRAIASVALAFGTFLATTISAGHEKAPL